MSLICTSSPTVMKGPPGYPSTGSPISAHRGQKERGESYISGDVRCHSGYTRYVRAVDAVHVESVELDSTRTDGTKTTKKLEEITVRYIIYRCTAMIANRSCRGILRANADLAVAGPAAVRTTRTSPPVGGPANSPFDRTRTVLCDEINVLCAREACSRMHVQEWRRGTTRQFSPTARRSAPPPPPPRPPRPPRPPEDEGG